MSNLTIEDITIRMHFKSLIPIERGDRIKFPEGSHFRVTEKVFNGVYDGEQQFLVTLHCTKEVPNWIALPVEAPKDRERGGYLRELEITLSLLNQQFEEIEDDE